MTLREAKLDEAMTALETAWHAWRNTIEAVGSLDGAADRHLDQAIVNALRAHFKPEGK
jgi:hypothetical protein